MKVLCSLPLAVWIGFWLAALGFVLGLVVGYRAGITAMSPNTTADHLGDVRSISQVCYVEGATSDDTYSMLIVMVGLPTALLS